MIRRIAWWPVCRLRGHVEGWIVGGLEGYWGKRRREVWGCRRCHRELIP